MPAFNHPSLCLEFDPPVNALGPQRALIYRNTEQILQSLNAFGGALLYQGMNTFGKVDTNIQPNHTASVTLPQTTDTGAPQTINFIARHTIDMQGALDQENIQYLNCAVRKAMGQLRFQVIGRHLFLTGMMTAQPVDPELGGTTTVGIVNTPPHTRTTAEKIVKALEAMVEQLEIDEVIHTSTERDETKGETTLHVTIRDDKTAPVAGWVIWAYTHSHLSLSMEIAAAMEHQSTTTTAAGATFLIPLATQTHHNQRLCLMEMVRTCSQQQCTMTRPRVRRHSLSLFETVARRHRWTTSIPPQQRPERVQSRSACEPATPHTRTTSRNLAWRTCVCVLCLGSLSA
ncbi:unnamed protein product [Vitrella brassicaformis CCMP3155]|uniref:Uncharacterized protein n=1 Tax=Vitrella brassicaformis (strain CCMP3155) TaxID=1169540 RepID=A0A0G4H2W2_VITBC|nr:unnamed protein product [Vitrella brassicaformis CCMP3155]|eukprot:CEM38013.1 unnamed protein product [Vitrella brassicaformis CCMP3155]